LGYVFYVDEVSCLVSIFEDVGWFVVEYAACKDDGASCVGLFLFRCRVIRLCLRVGSFSSFNQQHMNLFEVPKNFIDYSNVANSCSIGICISFELFDVIVFGWNRVFAKNQK